MSREDYRTEFNGEELNISQIIKIKKIKSGEKRFKKLIKLFKIESFQNNNNIITFYFNNQKYHYGIVSQKIRIDGTNKWLENPEEVIK